MLCFLSREKNKRTPDASAAAPATFAAAAKKDRERELEVQMMKLPDVCIRAVQKIKKKTKKDDQKPCSIYDKISH